MSEDLVQIKQVLKEMNDKFDQMIVLLKVLITSEQQTTTATNVNSHILQRLYERDLQLPTSSKLDIERVTKDWGNFHEQLNSNIKH